MTNPSDFLGNTGDKNIDDIGKGCQTVEGIYLAIQNGEADEDLEVILNYLHRKDYLLSFQTVDDLKAIFFEYVPTYDFKERVNIRKDLLAIIEEKFFNNDHPKITKINLENFKKLSYYLIGESDRLTPLQIIKSKLIDSIKGKAQDIVSSGIEQDRNKYNPLGSFLGNIINETEREIFVLEFLSNEDISNEEKIQFLDVNLSCIGYLSKINNDNLKKGYLFKYFRNSKDGNLYPNSDIKEIFISIKNILYKKKIIESYHEKMSIEYITSFLEDEEIPDNNKLEVLKMGDIVSRLNDLVGEEVIKGYIKDVKSLSTIEDFLDEKLGRKGFFNKKRKK